MSPSHHRPWTEPAGRFQSPEEPWLLWMTRVFCSRPECRWPESSTEDIAMRLPSYSFPSVELRKNLLSVRVIDLLQNRIWQRHPVDLPTALARIIPVREIFIVA